MQILNLKAVGKSETIDDVLVGWAMHSIVTHRSKKQFDSLVDVVNVGLIIRRILENYLLKAVLSASTNLFAIHLSMFAIRIVTCQEYAHAFKRLRAYKEKIPLGTIEQSNVLQDLPRTCSACGSDPRTLAEGSSRFSNL
jgi:hypothetical protein